MLFDTRGTVSSGPLVSATEVRSKFRHNAHTHGGDMTEHSWHWYRVSSGNGGSDDQDADKQRPDVEAWSTGHGYSHNAENESVIQGGSAFKGNKKFDREWAKVLQAFREHRVSVLVVWAMNRLDRKLNAMEMVKEIRELGGRVEFTEQPHLNKLSNMGERISFNVTMEIAHEESQQKARITHRDKNQKRAAGYITGALPWGFTANGEKDRKVPVATSVAVEYIPQVYRKITSGWSLGRVAKWLQTEGVPAPGRGVKDGAESSWYPRTVGSLIRNPAYKGELFNGYEFLRFDDDDKPVFGTVPYVLRTAPLVDAVTWQDAVDNLDARPKNVATRGQAPKAVLASVLYCPVCSKDGHESPMYRARSAYRCTGYGGVATRKGCGNNIPVTVADALADQAMAGQVTHLTRTEYTPPTDSQKHAQELRNSIDRLDKTDLTAFLARVAEIQAEIESLTDTAERTVTVTLPETYAGLWGTLDSAERGAWLREHSVRMYAAGSTATALYAAVRAARTDYTRSKATHALVTADGVTLAAFFGVLAA